MPDRTHDVPAPRLLYLVKQLESAIRARMDVALRPRRITVPQSPTAIHLAVHRLGFSVYYKRLDAEAYRLLVALRGGATLEDACATAFAGSKELPEQSAARLQAWFARWMEFGWFCRP